MFNVLAIGDPIIDTHVQIDDSSAEISVIPHGDLKLCLDYGSKIPIRNSFQNLGGNAPNVGLAAARLGLRTAVLSTIGNDVNGQTAIRELARHGVDTTYLSIDPKARTRYSIVLNYQKERTILSYSSPRTYAWPNPTPETNWIYYTGLSEGYESLHLHLMKYLHEHPTVRLAFNPGSYLLKFGRTTIPEIVSRADLLIVNLEEAETILGSTLEKEKSVRAIIHGLLRRGAKEVALTDAERGAWAGDQEKIWHMKSYPVPVVAKTGAGDSFSGAYLSARYLGHDIQHALAWGIANSSAVIQKEGCHDGLLDRAGIEKFRASFKTIVPFEV